ncbi:hypothetical protein KIN20_020864 [Parelaphostrongylus tenuis]|uniref:Uncharacterized protein n=2 Tax=Parelaphostrongylus tenuis TaxID=148309 RepID=A0AAD5N3N6_PARTN|nr:hypothetical protein KIN20_020864 [Parelaphostrongylus tenuis]
MVTTGSSNSDGKHWMSREKHDEATQMVHDSREQVVSKGARTFDRKWSKWRGRHPAATNLNSQFDRETSSARSFDFIQTTSPQIVVWYNPYKGFQLCSLVRCETQVGSRSQQQNH